MAEAKGEVLLVHRIGDGEGVLVRFFPGEIDQDVEVCLAEPGVGDLAGGSGRILREGPGVFGLEDAGVQQAVDIDVDMDRIRDGMRLVGDSAPGGWR